MAIPTRKGVGRFYFDIVVFVCSMVGGDRSRYPLGAARSSTGSSNMRVARLLFFLAATVPEAAAGAACAPRGGRETK